MASEWYDMKDKLPLRVSLQPNGMETLSSLSAPAPTNNPPPSAQKENKEVFVGQNAQPQWSPEKTKKQEEDLKKAISGKVTINYELEQDNMEGVDATEWDD